MFYLIYRNDNNLIVGGSLPNQDLQRVLNNFNYIEGGVSYVKYHKTIPQNKQYTPRYWNEETQEIDYLY